MANLSYFPVFFNPQTHQLRVLKNANLRVGFKGTDSINTLPTWPTSVASLYGNIYRSLILNYNTLGIQDETPPKYKYLIISDVSFADALNSFIFWKRKKGLDVVLETITTSEQRDTLYIKNLITFYYNNYRTDYVLLVGDGDEPREQNSYHGPPLLPFAYGWQWEIGGYGYIRSDYWYSTIIGDDDIADVALGRFSVWTPEQLTTVIDKLFSYERYPNASEWFIKSHDLVACSQAEDGYHACKIESIVPIITPFGFQYYDDYGQWASNADVIFHINNSAGPTPQKGVSLVNYRGHGECKAWAYGDDGWNYLYERFRNEEIYQLTNFAGADNAWLPIILEIACSCGRAGVTTYPLSDTTGHSECWFRHKDGGGVAALGATRPSATDPNHKFDAELYRVSFANQQSPHAPVQELGWTINYAKLKMAEAYGWERGSKDNVRMYHLMGDPEIDIYTGWNGYICTTHDSLIPIGPQQFLVKVYDSDENNIVPIPGTLVCLYKENDVYQIQYTDDNGEALFDISPQTIGVMHITATKHDYGPYEGICLVIAEDAGTGRQSETIPYPFSFNHASYLRQSNSVNITYQLPEATCVEISVFDATGRLVKVVEKGLKTEGVNHESWNCRAESGRRVGKGIYFIRLKTAKNETMKKVVIF